MRDSHTGSVKGLDQACLEGGWSAKPKFGRQQTNFRGGRGHEVACLYSYRSVVKMKQRFNDPAGCLTVAEHA